MLQMHRMKKQSTEADTIRMLEERLLQPSVRRSAQDISKLLADEFIEYGSSGQIFDKKRIVEGLQSEDLVEISLSDFKVKTLASGVILAIYRARQRESDGRERHSLRSSIWKLIDGRWQMIFHQGNPTKDGT